MSTDWITSDDYKQILHNRFNNDKIHFLDAEIKPISEDNEGFMGEHYKLKITFKDDGIQKQENFFIKTKPRNSAAQTQILSDMNCYDREIFLYDFLFKEYAKYGFDTSFAANSYHCIRDETLILEDMTLRNFKVPERQTIYDMHQVKCLLKSLALFHGAGFAYEHLKSKELDRPYSIGQEYSKYSNEIFYTMYIDGPSFGREWFDSSKESFESMIDQLPKDTEYKESFKNMLSDAKIGQAFVNETGVTKICGHGDLWSNNVLFRYENNVAPECCLIDYQIFRYFYPGFDVLLALHFNTDADFRSKHLNDLCQYYYDTLREILNDYGHKVEELLPMKDFYKGMELSKLEALMQVATDNAMIFVPADILTKTTNENMKYGTDIRACFAKIKNHVTAVAFTTDEKYRKIVTENLYDLYDALCERANEH